MIVGGLIGFCILFFPTYLVAPCAPTVQTIGSTAHLSIFNFGNAAVADGHFKGKKMVHQAPSCFGEDGNG